MVELRCGDSTVKTLIDSLSILTRRVTPQSLNKAKAGLVTGALVGAFIGLISSGSQSGPWHIGPGPGTAVLMGGVFGGTAGVLIGGFVGSEAGGDETYDLSRMTTGERVRVLRSVSLVYSN